MKIGITCDNYSALHITKWITAKYQNNNPNKPATLLRDIIFLFLILKYRAPPIVSPTTNRIGKQNKYLNIKTIDKETSFEKYFIMATIEVPNTISKNKKRAPRKYVLRESINEPFNFSPFAFKRRNASECPAIKIVLFFINQF